MGFKIISLGSSGVVISVADRRKFVGQINSIVAYISTKEGYLRAGNCRVFALPSLSDANFFRGVTAIFRFPITLQPFQYPVLLYPTEKDKRSNEHFVWFGSNRVSVGIDVPAYFRSFNPGANIWNEFTDAAGPRIEVQSSEINGGERYEVICDDRGERSGFIVTGEQTSADLDQVSTWPTYRALRVESGSTEIGVREIRATDDAQFNALNSRAWFEFRLSRYLTQLPPYHHLFAEIYSVRRIQGSGIVQTIIQHVPGKTMAQFIGDRISSGAIPSIVNHDLKYLSLANASEAQLKALPTIIKKLIRDMLFACAWLRANHLVHANISTETAMVRLRVFTADNGEVRWEPRLQMVGYSQMYVRFDASQHSSHPGTPGFAAPERIRHERSDTASDVFSAGLVLFKLVFGIDFPEIYNQIVTLDFSPQSPDQQSAIISSMTDADLTFLFANDQSFRLQMARRAQDIWGIAEWDLILNLISKMISIDPARRSVPTELLRHPYFVPEVTPPPDQAQRPG